MVDERMVSITACTGEGISGEVDVGEPCMAGEEGGAGGMVQSIFSLNFLVLSTLSPNCFSLAMHWSRSDEPAPPPPELTIKKSLEPELSVDP